MTTGSQPSARTRPVWQRMSAAWRSGPLAVRNFQLLTGGQFASTVGDYFYVVALPWLILSTHGGTVLLGTVLACYGVPRTVLIPVGGMLTDKIGARTMMLLADIVRCAVLAALTVLAARHVVSLVALGPLAALIGAGEGVFIPASFAIMPSLLEPSQLTVGNAVSQAALRTGSLIGPALGGALVAFAGSAPAFAVDAGSFAVSALTLALIPRRRARAVSAEHGGASKPAAASAGRADSNDGPGELGVFGMFRQRREMRLNVAVAIVANVVAGGLTGVALPALAHARFGATGYGALLACFAAGGLIGTLLAARTGHLRKPAVFGGLTFVVYGAIMGLIPYLGEAGAAAALFVFGGCHGLGNVIMFTAGQKSTPPHLLGRVMGLIMMCLYGLYPLSVALAAILVRHLGPTPYFPIAGAIVCLAFLGGLSQKEYRDFGSDQSDSTYALAGTKSPDNTAMDPVPATTPSEGTDGTRTLADR